MEGRRFRRIDLPLQFHGRSDTVGIMSSAASLRTRAVLTGCLLAVLQLGPGHLNGPLEPLDRFGVPPLLPDWWLQLFACFIAFLLGYGFSLIPHPEDSDHFLVCAAARSLLVGIMAAAAVFEIAYFCSRLPMISDVSLSHALRPWTRILPLAFGAAILPTWWLLFSDVAKRARRFLAR